MIVDVYGYHSGDLIARRVPLQALGLGPTAEQSVAAALERWRRTQTVAAGGLVEVRLAPAEAAA